ncbi:MAG: LysE family translocator [Alphaproteobacteria bacterium]|nr:LysE family translocator [Alphaproteobacteria bacterium]
MALDAWLSFVAAAGIMLAIPGPTVTLVVSYAIAEGRRSAWSTVVGVMLGDFTAMTLSLLGLGALLAASATLFTLLKWAGAAYLVYLGIRLWRAPVAADSLPDAQPRRAAAMLGHAFAVTALNPKGIVFFVAFLPQFMDATMPLPPQAVALGATFLAMAGANAALYAALASRARDTIRRPAVLRWVNRIGGTVLVGAGVAAVALKRS